MLLCPNICFCVCFFFTFFLRTSQNIFFKQKKNKLRKQQQNYLRTRKFLRLLPWCLFRCVATWRMATVPILWGSGHLRGPDFFSACSLSAAAACSQSSKYEKTKGQRLKQNAHLILCSFLDPCFYLSFPRHGLAWFGSCLHCSIFFKITIPQRTLLTKGGSEPLLIFLLWVSSWPSLAPEFQRNLEHEERTSKLEHTATGQNSKQHHATDAFYLLTYSKKSGLVGWWHQPVAWPSAESQTPVTMAPRVTIMNFWPESVLSQFPSFHILGGSSWKVAKGLARTKQAASETGIFSMCLSKTQEWNVWTSKLDMVPQNSDPGYAFWNSRKPKADIDSSEPSPGNGMLLLSVRVQKALLPSAFWGRNSRGSLGTRKGLTGMEDPWSMNSSKAHCRSPTDQELSGPQQSEFLQRKRQLFPLFLASFSLTGLNIDIIC